MPSSPSPAPDPSLPAPSPAADAALQERKREQTGWYFYDFANSAFNSTVVTLFMGPYLTAVARQSADADGLIRPLGIALDPRALWGLVVSCSVLFQVLVLPVVAAVADYGRKKKRLLGCFAYLGASLTVALFFVVPPLYWLGGLLFIFANLSFGAANVVSNSFLPEISTSQERDAVSSRGWGIGYLGGGLLLALNLVFLGFAPKWGLSEALAVRISLASAGLWWAGFALIPLSRLRDRGSQRDLPAGQSVLSIGFREFLHTVKDMMRHRQTCIFLLGYLLYNDAIQTVISMAGQFGSDDLKIPMSRLALAILMVQFVAFAGAFLFKWIAARLTAQRAVLLALVLWTGVLAYAYLAVSSELEFFVLAALVGLIMGGTQALSRSMFSRLIPTGKEAEYFSLYEISDKGTSWIGPLVFAVALNATGSYRAALLSLVVFFVAGFLFLRKVDLAKGEQEARPELP